MGPLAKLLERMPLLLQGIRLGVGPAVHNHFRRVNFRRLPAAARRLHFAAHRHAAARRELLHFALIVRQLRVGDDLNVGEARAVVELEKAEPTLRIAPRANPTLQRDLTADRVGLSCSGNRQLVHR